MYHMTYELCESLIVTLVDVIDNRITHASLHNKMSLELSFRIMIAFLANGLSGLILLQMFYLLHKHCFVITIHHDRFFAFFWFKHKNSFKIILKFKTILNNVCRKMKRKFVGS